MLNKKDIKRDSAFSPGGRRPASGEAGALTPLPRVAGDEGSSPRRGPRRGGALKCLALSGDQAKEQSPKACHGRT